ncbi:O-antigen ligase family protein [Sulfitobacter sp. S0837]|uniref:O-antigen ligase family protein n=1 Tax=Sulfitobacter maritimus TaxID=2741719 RepID=UPI001583563E|nr:O-antigen ligase family protein [Sulfitobacter maritimus]NUH65508.1 O-antigen ligase family protein [Sulfitobacter maritimus]
MGINTAHFEGIFLLTLVAAVSSIAVVSNVIELPAPMILGAFTVIPIVIWMVARPPLAIAFVFFCFFTNAQQVFSLVHGFDYLTELLLLLLVVLFVNDLSQRRLPGATCGIFASLLLLNAAFVLLQVSFGAGMQFAVEIIKHGLITLIVLILLIDIPRIKGALAGIVLALAFMSGISVIQYIFDLYHLSFGGFGAATYHHIVGDVDYWRIDGPLTDPNYYAQVLLISLPFAIMGAARSASIVWKILCVIALCAGVAALLLTYSRGALIGFAVLVVAYSYGRWRLLLFTGAALSLLLFAVDGSYLERLSVASSDIIALLRSEGYLQDTAISGRLSEMVLAIYLFLEHPMFGIGVGQYEGLYQDAARHFGLMARGADREAHSLLLELLAERGLVGTLIYLLTAGGALFCALRARARGGAATPMVRALLYALLAYASTSLFLHEAFPMYLWLLIALCFSVAQIAPLSTSAQAREGDLWTYEDETEGGGYASH